MLDRTTRPHDLLIGLREILSHGAITLLAVVLAFTAPDFARYILFEWWPRVESDPNLMLQTEIALASVLVLLFNFAKLTWDSRHCAASARRASLVYVRDRERGWLARWREQRLVKQLPAARDAFVLTLTGHDTFVDDASVLRGVVETAYEIRVLLANPSSEGLRRRADTLPDEVTLHTFRREIEGTIGYLAELRRRGKSVTLKFYDQEPFWKLVILGDHVWVQHCHSGIAVNRQPEYVFARHHRIPREGLFVPFYTCFLNQWSNTLNPEYDFDRAQLVYRDAAGNETGRTPFSQ